MKVLISGSRSIKDPSVLQVAISLSRFPITELICGMCPEGVDKLALDWATENSIQVLPYPADWKKFGRSAGMIRNTEMVKAAQAVIAVWDGKSPGTKNAIDRAKQLNCPIFVYKLI